MKMTVTLTLPPEVETRVQEEADLRSLKVEDYLVRLVTDTLHIRSEEDPRTRALRLLDAMRETGDEAEQQETFTTLKEAVEADRLSDRKRFG